MIPIQGDELLTTKEAAARSGLHFRHLGNLARQGKIAAQKVGVNWLIKASSLAAYTSAPRKTGPKPHIA